MNFMKGDWKRTQAPLKAEATRRRGGELRKIQEREVEEEEEKEKKEEGAKHRKRRWWKKCKEIIISLFTMRTRKGEEEKESRERARRPKARQAFGDILGSGSFSFCYWGRIC